MNAFELIDSESGQRTVKHSASGLTIHSTISPRSEAAAMARLLVSEHVTRVCVVGHGLGYFSEALENHGIACSSAEVFPELSHLCREAMMCEADMAWGSQQALQAWLADQPSNSRLVILPYVLSLRGYLSSQLLDFVEQLHVMNQSQKLYRGLITTNIGANRSELECITRLRVSDASTPKIGVAVGAGPTLAATAQMLKERRDELVLIAASGAVPALERAGIHADWIVAMEARETTSRDLAAAPDGARVVVFSWTDPTVVKENRFERFFADDSIELETSGGSTGLAAADLALKITQSAVFMIGMDMSDRHGEYAQGSARDTANMNFLAPKFKVMRKSASQWAQANEGRRVYHMVMPGDDAIRGARQLYPVEFDTEISRELNRRSMLAESVR